MSDYPDWLERLSAAEQLFMRKAYDFVTLYGSALGDSDEAREFRVAAQLLQELQAETHDELEAYIADQIEYFRAQKVRDVWWDEDGTTHTRPCTDPHDDYEGTGDSHAAATEGR